MKKGHIILILIFFGIFNSFCQNKPIPSHGSYEKTPGETWDRGFVSGNGRMGAILYGKPGEEILVTNHCRLYLPLGSREIVPDLSGVVDTMREIYRENPSSAEKFLTAEAKKQGFNGLVWTDPFHPGMFVKIKQPTQGTIRDYQRTEDFSTGEVIVSWKDDRGEYVRKMFVSRPDNMIVVSLAGPTPCELEFEKITHELILSEQKIGKDLITYHNVYKKGKGGYDVAVRIIKKDMGRNTLLLFRIVPWKTPLSPDISEAWANSLSNPDFKACGNFNPKPALTESSVISFLKNEDAKSLIPKLVKSLNSEKSDYSQLLNQHMALHQELFERVRLDLNGGHEREMTTTELLKIADQENRLPAALMEKMYDAGRYMLICSAGETLPNLHGIWTGTWNPVWSGDYTLDTNVQAALASSCSSNLPELLKGYFNIMESYYPEWRINAKRMYGCRGLLTNSRASNTALMLHWGTWDGNYWTAGCGWLASFFTQYSDYTCDETFIRNQCIPLLKDIATFYEDFLVKNKEGEYEFIPSYNPETGAGINSSMDIEVAKEVISNLIRYSKQLNFETQNLAKWEQLMEKLPKLNLKNGILGEFQDGKIESQHRHHSQFYGCYQSFDIAFEKNPIYRIAAQNSLRLKIYGSDYANGEQSSFGRVQSGISAAYLGMPNEAYNRLKVMAVKQSMEPSLITSHEPNQVIFNTDGNGGIPQIVSTMLLQSRPDVIKMLPALPKEWPSGKITGMLAQGGFEVTIEWKEGELKRVLLKSNKGNPTKLIYKEKITTVDLKKGEVKEFLY